MRDKLFFMWLAGHLDGGGGFYLGSKGKLEISICTHTSDLQMLQYVKDTLGYGYLRHRPDKNCYIYCLYRRADVIDLLHNVNGLIYNSVKFESFSKMCVYLGIIPIPATLPNSLSPYYAGFFDANGTIGCYLSNKYYNLSIGVSNKFEVDVLPLKITFGGNTNRDRSTYVWSVSSKVNILAFLDYYKSINHFKSFKSTKFLLIEEYYELKALRAWKPESIHHPRWLVHYPKWCRKGYDDK